MPGHTGILKGNIQQVDALVWGEKLAGQARQDGAVEAARKQDGNPGFIRTAVQSGRRRNVQNPHPH